MADLPDWRAPQHLAVSAPMPRQSYPSRNLAGQAPKDAPDQALPDARPPAWKAECAETQPPEAAHRLSNGGGSVSACAFLTDCRPDRKSTRLNSSHVRISYAVFCLKKKNFLRFV